MMTLNVSNIQRFSVGDGPGIRTTVFLKGCNLHCPWCHNPETVSAEPQTLVYPHTGKTVRYGTDMPVEEVARRVCEDRAFYRQSGGGVTVSGGEPLLQASAVAALLRQLQGGGIHTLVDTAGAVPFACFETVLPYTDCFFYDWKSPLPQVYREVIGGELPLVEENLSRLLNCGRQVHVRMPVIPGMNDRPADIALSAERLERLGVQYVDLLPFHRLASEKYAAMGIPYAYAGVQPPTGEHIEAMAQEYRKSFTVTVEW